MILILVAIFLTAEISYSEECVTATFETSEKVTQLQSFADELKEKIEWFTASDKDVDNAKCVDDENFSDEAIAKYLNSFGDELSTTSIQGVSLTDHPRKIELLKKFLRTSFFQPQIELSENAKSCKDVDCVAKDMFGTQANNYMYLLDKYGFNLNDKRVRNTAKWNDSEVDHIMKSINYIPKQILPFETNQTFVRGLRGNYGGNSYANATIYFFDSNFDQTPQMQTYTLFHEVGHNMASEMELDLKNEWTSISEWKPEYLKDANGEIEKNFSGEPKISNWHHGHNHSMPSEYAQTNPQEDFAESFSAYRFNPKKLKAVSPKKYDYMKNNIFQGIEYLTEESCQKENSSPYKFFNKEDAKLPNTISDLSACQEAIPAILNQGLSKKQISDCAKKLKAQTAIKKQISKQSPPLTKLQTSSILNSSLLPIEQVEVSDKDLVETKKLLTEEIMNSMIKNLNVYANCEKQKSTLKQSLEDIEEKTTDFQYIYSFEKDLDDSLYKICKEFRSVKEFSCSDDLWRLTSDERRYRNSLCPTSEDIIITCDKDLSKYKDSSKRTAYNNLCKSTNISPPEKMRCNLRTKTIFARLAGISLEEISTESKDIKQCSF